MVDNQKSDQALRDQVAILSYVDDLMRDKADKSLKPEQVPNIRALLLKEVNEAINEHLINCLNEQKQVELDELLDKDATDEQVMEFFKKTIPNVEVEVTTALLNFRAAYLYSVLNPQKSTVSSPLSPVNSQPSSVTRPLSAVPSVPPVLTPAPAVVSGDKDKKWN